MTKGQKREPEKRKIGLCRESPTRLARRFPGKRNQRTSSSASKKIDDAANEGGHSSNSSESSVGTSIDFSTLGALFSSPEKEVDDAIYDGLHSLDSNPIFDIGQELSKGLAEFCPNTSELFSPDYCKIDGTSHYGGYNSDSETWLKCLSFKAGKNSPAGSEIADSKLVNNSFLSTLVQEKESLLNLEQEVVSTVLQDKIKELRENYTSFRRVRGDGNCFFRAFKFAYLEYILLMNDVQEANRMLARIEERKDRILQNKMRLLETLLSDYDAFYDIVTFVSPSSENRISHAVLLERSKNEKGYSDHAIRFLRMVTSNEICSRPEDFEQSIQGLSCDATMTAQRFCEVEVVPMGKDVDNVQIAAFVDAVGVPVRIEYVHDSRHRLNHFDFGIEASPLEKPFINLLYRPGHYDILYSNEYHMLVPVSEDVFSKDMIQEKELRTVHEDPWTSKVHNIEKDQDMDLPPLHSYHEGEGSSYMPDV